MKSKIILFSQLPASLAIIAFVPTNLGKLFAFFILWVVTFRNSTKAEIIYVVGVCILFTVMNAASLHRGIFSFSDPDFLGMPVYEVFMWGFYLLHIKRFLGGPVPTNSLAPACTIATVFAASFALIRDPIILTATTAAVIAVAFLIYHEPYDFIYTTYLTTFGAFIEYVGVYSGQWTYPDAPIGGVPIWFMTLWGGVGLLSRRCFLPMVAKYEQC